MQKLGQHAKRGLNFMHFHRRRLLVSASFLSVYSFMCNKSINSPSEILRLGIAGSLTHLVVESMFHFVDTVNVQAKLSEKSISSLNMVR